MPIRNWSPTAAQNNAAPPYGWPEGMPPSGVNDTARQMMADTRAGFEDLPWLEWPDAITYANANAFLAAGDLRARYQVGRRVRAMGSATGTVYGTISASSFGGGQTTVTLAWDSGSLQSEPLTVALGPGSTGLPIGLAAIKGGDDLATLSAIAQAQVPVGSVIAWPLPGDPPDGYLACDGAAVSRTTYADLFAVLGTAYGPGNGTTTFDLPDYSRRALVGAGGTGTAVLGNEVGDTGGAETHTLTTAELPAFNLTVSASTFGDAQTGGSKGALQAGGGTISTSSIGSGTPFSTMPPSAVVQWCIRWRKTSGTGSGGGGGGGGSGGGGASTAVLDLGSMGSAKTLDTLTYGAFSGTLSAASCALTLDNPNLGATYVSRVLRLVQDATGGRSVAWPNNVAWQGGFAPSLGPAAGAADVIQLTSFDGGAHWYAAVAFQIPGA